MIKAFENTSGERKKNYNNGHDKDNNNNIL